VILPRAGRLADALLYARVAQRRFAACHNAEEMVARAQGLIERIEAATDTNG
jgi:hypothetical protein